MVNRLESEALFISNEDERKIYLKIVKSDGSVKFYECNVKNDFNDVEVALSIDMLSIVMEQDVEDMRFLPCERYNEVGQMDIFGKLLSILSQNKKGIYAYQTFAVVPSQQEIA